MSLDARTERVQTRDGDELTARLVLPSTGSGPGILVLHEIFALDAYVMATAVRLARLGYVAMALDVDRRHSRMAAMSCDLETAVRDAVAALRALGSVREVTKAPAVLGFCLGASLAWRVAARAGPAAAVCYYGAAIPSVLEAAGVIACPVLLHFGGRDARIPSADVRRVAALAASRAAIECHVHEGAGHGFDNHHAPELHRPAVAANAWQITSAFLARAFDGGRADHWAHRD